MGFPARAEGGGRRAAWKTGEREGSRRCKADDALRHFTKILEQDIGFRDVAQKVEALKA